MQLYDLAAAEPERRFSPYCWRIKMALAHKGLVPTGNLIRLARSRESGDVRSR
jgi:hypothetical protein